MSESVDAIVAAGFEVVSRSTLEVGTDRLLGSMLEFDEAGGFRRTPMGDDFFRNGLDPPIFFGEISAIATGA